MFIRIPKQCRSSATTKTTEPQWLCSVGRCSHSGLKKRVVQYWRLVSTRKAHLSIRTSRTNRLMNSPVVVDPCIFIGKTVFCETSDLRSGRARWVHELVRLSELYIRQQRFGFAMKSNSIGTGYAVQIVPICYCWVDFAGCHHLAIDRSLSKTQTNPMRDCLKSQNICFSCCNVLLLATKWVAIHSVVNSQPQSDHRKCIDLFLNIIIYNHRMTRSKASNVLVCL